jgi:hypothetical protein
MTHDEQDPREQRPEDDSSGSTEEQREAADEFETASWPAQDRPADEAVPDGATPPEPSPDEAPPDEAPWDEEASRTRDEWGEPVGDLATAEPRSDAGPPPSDAEAYEPVPAPVPAPEEEALPAHSVPATEPGESTRCQRCGTENRPGIAFCRNCGQRLVAAGAPTTVERPSAPEGTQACPRCGTHNRAGVAFCQNCGANLRAAEPGYVPPAVSPAGATEAGGGRAILGPIVLLIGAVGIVIAWLLPFPFGPGSLYDRAFGSTDGYGIGFWNAYDGIGGLASQAYFGFAAPAPILVLLLGVLAVAGFLRPAPAILQWIGLAVAVIWAIGLGTLFVVVEIFGGAGGGVIDILRGLTAGGIIFLLASLIVLIGALTRFGRG